MLSGLKFASRESVVAASEKDTADTQRKAAPDVARKESGLEWMLKAPSYPASAGLEQKAPSASVPDDEVAVPNSKELNPYLKSGGPGYPSDVGDVTLEKIRGSSLPKAPVVGDGGASWRLKALKRAKEQAEREGRRLNEVVEERWGSLGEMTSGSSVRRAAHANAHLHAIRDRKRKLSGFMDQEEGEMENPSAATILQRHSETEFESGTIMKSNSTGYRKDSKMKAPRENASLSWTRDKYNEVREKDAETVQASDSSMNKFTNDGSFLKKFKEKQADYFGLDAKEKDPQALRIKPGAVQATDSSSNKSNNDRSFLKNFKEKHADYFGLDAKEKDPQALRIKPGAVQATDCSSNKSNNDGSFLKKFKEKHADFFGFDTKEKDPQGFKSNPEAVQATHFSSNKSNNDESFLKKFKEKHTDFFGADTKEKDPQGLKSNPGAVQATDFSSNKSNNDGSFLKKFKEKHAEFFGFNSNEKDAQDLKSKGLHVELEGPTSYPGVCEEASQSCELTQNVTADKHTNVDVNIPQLGIQGMSINQLAAKALQLRLRGKLAEADKLLRQVERMKQEDNVSKKDGPQDHLQETCNRLVKGPSQGVAVTLKSMVSEHKIRNQRNDGDAEMAASILRNRQYSTSTSLDDEYECGPDFPDLDIRKSKSSRHKQGSESSKATQEHNRIITQKERCQFCFDNPSRSKHLTLSIANSTYLMLPPKEPLVEGHCYILPLQHEGSTRSVDENVWEELRNYKKCLFKMFAQQERGVIFIETAIGLAQQRRHCLVECIPLPQHVAEQAPLYFKKAIDEAEDEWSQHNAKKLIDTSIKGLRGSIPKHFPYFHVEFGMQSGFVHVIDDEKNFKSHFGRDVVVGMLKLSEERMYRPQRQISYESQDKAVREFQKMWEPFDWTKMLD